MRIAQPTGDKAHPAAGAIEIRGDVDGPALRHGSPQALAVQEIDVRIALGIRAHRQIPVRMIARADDRIARQGDRAELVLRAIPYLELVAVPCHLDVGDPFPVPGPGGAHHVFLSPNRGLQRVPLRGGCADLPALALTPDKGESGSEKAGRTGQLLHEVGAEPARRLLGLLRSANHESPAHEQIGGSGPKGPELSLNAPLFPFTETEGEQIVHLAHDETLEIDGPALDAPHPFLAQDLFLGNAVHEGEEGEIPLQGGQDVSHQRRRGGLVRPGQRRGRGHENIDPFLARAVDAHLEILCNRLP